MSGLREYLQKSEIEYIANHGGGYPETFKWDANIESHLKRIGFKIKKHFDADGEWICTSDGITVDNDGFICKIKNKPTGN